ncbi:MAG: phosphonate transport system substrate-binding protein [Kiritimatiellia bacterium]|jgi:phosphonate transport system substrate-binding protein
MLRKTFITSIVLGLACWISGCGNNEPAPTVDALTPPVAEPTPDEDAGEGHILTFSAIPDQNSTDLKEKFDKIAIYLTDKLGFKVVYKASSSYEASVEEFRNGNIQLAWFGGLSGVQARHFVPGAQAIAQGKADPTFYSYFIAHKDSGLTESETFPTGIAGVPFCFGSEGSTSGRLMPQHFIEKNSGKSLPDFFGDNKPAFSGTHDNTYEWVKAGKVKAGALNYVVYNKLKAADGDDAPTVIWTTPTYADYNFTAHPDLEKTFGEGFTKKLQQVLVDMKDPELLSAFPREALIPATNEEFDGIKKVAENLGFLN